MVSIFFRILAYWKHLVALLIPIVLLPIPLIYQSKTASCAYCVLIMASYWMTEAIPIPVTALLPIFLYPVLGIADTETITKEYLKDSIMVFVGGLMVALAFEFCNLHKRVALRVMLATGTSLGMLMLGTMLTTLFLSCWMFNTATTAMMVPIIQAVLDELQKTLEDVYEKDDKKSRISIPSISEVDSSNNELILDSSPQEKNSASENELNLNMKVIKKRNKLSFVHDHKAEASVYNNASKSKTGNRTEEVRKCIQEIRTMFLLSTCYSSNIGGTGVITGSGTNLVALEFLGDLDPKHHGDYASLTFAIWSAFNFLPMMINIFVAWIYLQLVFLGIPAKWKFWKSKAQRDEDIANNIFHPELEAKIKIMLKQKYLELGSLTFHEVGVGICFLTAVVSWILHDPKFIPGWSELFYGGPKVSISTATLFIGVLFFIIPRNPEFYRGFVTGEFVPMKPLLEWEFVQRRFPWGVIILLGGGYALSKGAKSAGLNEVIGQSLKSFSHLSPSLIQLSVMGMIAFITEVTSNTATASIVVPILLELSKELNIHPLYLTLPATITCSYAFMLPVATPPNALVYSAGNMKVFDMIKTGLFMNIACVLVLYMTTNLYGNLFFHFTEYNYIP